MIAVHCVTSYGPINSNYYIKQIARSTSKIPILDNTSFKSNQQSIQSAINRIQMTCIRPPRHVYNKHIERWLLSLRCRGHLLRNSHCRST